MTPLERAIDAVGGISALASEIGVKSSTPSMWKKRGNVPADYCPAIEKATSKKGAVVRCEELRPDVDWSVLRRNPRKQKAGA